MVKNRLSSSYCPKRTGGDNLVSGINFDSRSGNVVAFTIECDREDKINIVSSCCVCDTCISDAMISFTQ